jgi:Pyruvate/2-oxoacid:ferredoxin oxidoreductase gamma subunit
LLDGIVGIPSREPRRVFTAAVRKSRKRAAISFSIVRAGSDEIAPSIAVGNVDKER